MGIKVLGYTADPYRDNIMKNKCPECTESCQNKWHYPKKPVNWKRIIYIIGMPLGVGIFFHGVYLLATSNIEGGCEEIVLPTRTDVERKCGHSKHILTETSQNWLCICNSERSKDFKK